MKNRTVKTLIEILQTLPEDAIWNGWDDGSIYILENETSYIQIADISNDADVPVNRKVIK